MTRDAKGFGGLPFVSWACQRLRDVRDVWDDAARVRVWMTDTGCGVIMLFHAWRGIVVPHLPHVPRFGYDIDTYGINCRPLPSLSSHELHLSSRTSQLDLKTAESRETSEIKSKKWG